MYSTKKESLNGIEVWVWRAKISREGKAALQIRRFINITLLLKVFNFIDNLKIISAKGFYLVQPVSQKLRLQNYFLLIGELER